MESVISILGVWGIVLVGIILIILAYLGSLLPALPGVPFACAAVFLVHFTLYHYSWYVLLVVILLTIAISYADYVLPVWGTKKYGGSKAGIRGSTIGLIAGATLSFLSGGIGTIALFAGPFIGAYIGERYIAKADKNIALRSAWGSLVGFMAGTIGKIAVVTTIGVIFVIGVIKHV
jgi:hypothetical protein